ncbi:isoprenylcysteine carboxylmethyltransferase family protein [Pseudolysobacter antarcticus]|uniref:methanethiol S-methyltransferase n=1 Tax=Pseudolysobacter antarcticus TaxID=2511995 RepID=A0A411HL95_9GAMM|nr:methanethiol S-methyltransferase [Pseudolysobacter antarcticus]QBB71184.1 isoprenylcysteine carboxylmethyltransferase family protein [Pseudolysobacter antarcticus]
MNLFYRLYALLSYGLFLAWFLYAVGFVGDLFVPKSISAPAGVGGWTALIVDTAVLVAFAIQHSVMARPAFKQLWTSVVPTAIERSTYVLFSSLFFFLVFVAWQPLPTAVWDLHGTLAAQVLLVMYALGWLVVLLSSFMISHFELFGLTQAWRRARDVPAPDSAFIEVFFYRFVRHPIMLGFLLVCWAAPVMTQGRLLFALLMSAYIFIGVRLEEHDLVQKLGDVYRNYRTRVPMVLPLPRRKQLNAAAADKSDVAG